MTSLLWLHKGMLINVHLHMIAQNVEKSVSRMQCFIQLKQLFEYIYMHSLFYR